MLKTKYDLLVRNGKERFIVIPEKEYDAIQERQERETLFKRPISVRSRMTRD